MNVSQGFVVGADDAEPYLFCRYSGWMMEAKRRNEDEWHESLESESVRSLSRSFYDSFAMGHCSGSVSGKVSWTSLLCLLVLWLKSWLASMLVLELLLT